MAVLRTVDRCLRKFLGTLCLLLFIVLALILLTNVFLRLGNDLVIFLERKEMPGLAESVKSMLPLTSMHWFDEIVELVFAAMVFYGAAELWAVKGHFSVGDWISKRLPGIRLAAFYKIIVTLFSLAFAAVFFWYSLRLTMTASELSTVFQIPKKVMYSCMPISSFIMMCYSFAELIVDIRRLLVGDEKAEGQGATSM